MCRCILPRELYFSCSQRLGASLEGIALFLQLWHAGVQGWLEAWFRATRVQLIMAVVITELAVDIDATSAPREAAPGIFLARLGPQQRLPAARLSALPLLSPKLVSICS